MQDYSQKDWYKKEVEKYISEYGEVPPQWKIFPDTHPYSIMWRMGGGETFAMVFTTWFEGNFKSEIEKIQYFLKHNPPPRWLETVASYLWDIDYVEEFEHTGYLSKLKEMGFEGTEKYVEDIEDPRWLE